MSDTIVVENTIYFVVSICGLLLAWRLFRSPWPGWLGFPIALLVIQATRDLGIAPLTLNLLGYEYKLGILFTRMHGIDAWRGGSLILLSYVSIAGGMVIVRRVSGVFGSKKSPVSNHQSYPLSQSRHAWQIAALFFMAGLMAQLTTLVFVLPGRSLANIAAERAIFTDEEALVDPIYGYARLLSPVMQMGALAMMFQSGKSKSRQRLGIAANLLYVAFEVLYGGRARLIIGVLSLVLAYHYSVRPLRICSLIPFALVAILGLALISINRFRAQTAEEIWAIAARSILASDFARIDDAAWLSHVFPKQMPFTGWLNLPASILRVIPRLSIRGTNSMYNYIVDFYYGGVNPSAGIGGFNYSTAGETYSWGGYASVVAFGLLAGLVFGMIFEWQRRSPGNPYLKVLSLMVLVWTFFLGIQSRLPMSIGNTGFFVIPLAVMAAVTLRGRHSVLLLLLLYFDLAALIAWYGFRDSLNVSFLRVGILASVPLAYLIAIKVLTKADLTAVERAQQELHPVISRLNPEPLRTSPLSHESP